MQLNLFVFSTTVKIDVWNLLHDVNKSLYDFSSDTNPFENPESVMLQLVIQVCKQYLWDNLDDIYSSERWNDFQLTDDRLKDLKRCMSKFAD